MDLSKIILSSDFDTLKNEAFISGSITIPNNVTVAGNGMATYSQDVTVTDTPIDNTAFSTGSLWHLLSASQSSIDRTGTIGGVPSPYSLFLGAYYTSRTNLRYEVLIMNPYNVSLNTGAGITVNFRSATFSDPFA